MAAKPMPSRQKSADQHNFLAAKEEVTLRRESVGVPLISLTSVFLRGDGAAAVARRPRGVLAAGQRQMTRRGASLHSCLGLTLKLR
jgi:hypothetical protein